MHIVPLLSVPFTGHWFLVAFLRELRLIRHEVELQELRHSKGFLTLPNGGPPGVRPDRPNLVHGPLRELDMHLIERLCAWWRPLMPLRDPLATFISARNRQPDADLHWLLERWFMLLTDMEPFAPHYIPLDLLKEPQERHKALIELLRAAQLSGGPDADPLVTLWAHKWPKDQYNSRGLYSLKIAYANRDLKYLEAHGMGADLKALMGAEGALRPFLVKQGYRSLLWWTPGGAEEESVV